MTKLIKRCGVPHSDWVSGDVWAFPDTANAPPVADTVYKFGENCNCNKGIIIEGKNNRRFVCTCRKPVRTDQTADESRKYAPRLYADPRAIPCSNNQSKQGPPIKHSLQINHQATRSIANVA